MNKTCQSHIAQEQRTVEQMIRLYCRRKEGNKELCPQCLELLEYARTRLSRCPFGENKTTCRLCPVHCYKPGATGNGNKNTVANTGSSVAAIAGAVALLAAAAGALFMLRKRA